MSASPSPPPPIRPPDLEGPKGRAWRSRATLPATCPALWLVHRPGAHPFWSYWMVSVADLRDVPGVPPAHLHFAGAEYELAIIAINPDACPAPEPDQALYPYLRPFDVVHQFKGLGDDGARELAAFAARCIVNGASPDQDFRRAWARMLEHEVIRLHALRRAGGGPS